MTIVDACLSRDGHIADMFRLVLAGILMLWLAACERPYASRPVVDVHALAEQGEARLPLQSLAGTDDVDRRGVCYRTPLMLAAGNGHSEVVRPLAEAGPDVDDIEITRGWTALIWAAKCGHVETVRTLLDLGADATIRDAQGRSAFDWARANRHPAIARLLTS